MVDTSDLSELVPHYLAMLVLTFLALGVVRVAVGDLNFWAEFAVIGVIVFSYRPIVMRLGIGPSRWE